MKRPALFALLAVAALAVGAQNYVFFSSIADRPRAVLEDDEEEALWDESESDALREIGTARVAAWVSEQAGRGRSPFLTAAEARLLQGSASFVSPAGGPRLSGTLWSRGRRIAWIDGRAHVEGDFVGEHRIDRIEPARVLLRRGDETLPLTVSNPGTTASTASSEAASDDE